jgi:hypothetical protein
MRWFSYFAAYQDLRIDMLFIRQPQFDALESDANERYILRLMRHFVLAYPDAPIAAEPDRLREFVRAMIEIGVSYGLNDPRSQALWIQSCVHFGEYFEKSGNWESAHEVLSSEQIPTADKADFLERLLAELPPTGSEFELRSSEAVRDFDS